MLASTANPEYLSMTELARRLELPESTMRYYCKRFARFLPYKGEGRRRRYAPETEKTLVFIASAMHHNKNATAVELMLQSGQYLHGSQQAVSTAPSAVPSEPPRQEQPEMAGSVRMLMDIMERQAQALGKISENLGTIAHRLDFAPGFAGPEKSLEDTGDLRQDITILKQQMSTAEQVHQEDLEQLRKWLGHLSEAVAKLSS